MKNLLVPTDFSACAQHAVHAAVSYIESFGGTLTLLHCVNLPENWHLLAEEEKKKLPEVRQKMQNAEDLLEATKRKYASVPIQYFIGKGALFHMMEQKVHELETDLVIMGSYGSSGKSEYFIGSNTQKVVRAIHCPVLVIKDPLPDIHFKKMVYASSFNTEEKEVFLRFKAFVKEWDPVVHLVVISTGSFFDAPVSVTLDAMETFKQLAEPLECHVHFFKDLTVDAGIRNFSQLLHADLIAISNFNRKPLKRMLVGSNVEALVNHANMPVLSFDFK